MGKDDLEAAIHQTGLSVRDKALFCLSLEPHKTRPLSEIRSIGLAAGWPQAKTTNLSDCLGKSRGLAAKMPDGWKLTDEGKKYVIKTAKLPSGPKQSPASAKLRKHLPNIQNPDVAKFVEEAIQCLEYGLLRSAVVLSWVGACGVLYDHVLNKKLADFNAAGAAKIQKWKHVTTFDDLSDMKEATFLDLCEWSSVFGKSVKKELVNCKDFRNGCGHPNSLAVGEARVIAHIEQLILNVFEKF